MTSVRFPSHLVSNRLVQENYEDRQYQAHLKKLEEIRISKSDLANISRFPDINYKHDLDYLTGMESESNRSPDYYSRLNLRNVKKYSKSKIKSESWASDYQKNRDRLRNSKMNRSKEIEIENLRLLRKLQHVKPTLNKKEWEKDFVLHQSIVHSHNKKIYTPRGIGHRKYNSYQFLNHLQDGPQKKEKKSAIKMLNAAVKKQDAAETVLIKTMASLNYYERMETKKKYEDTYDSDLKKGLMKVTDKALEPLIHAFLTDMNTYDSERIYESLYEPIDAAVVITEALLSRCLSERDALKAQFKLTIDSDLKEEINDKIEGDLNKFLINFLQNKSLDNNTTDEHKLKDDIKELVKSDSIPTDSNIILNLIRHDSKKQINLLFSEYQKIDGSDIFTKIDTNKPIGKALKLIQNYLSNKHLYIAEKLSKNLKTNKSEFLRLLALYPKNDLLLIMKEYKKRHKISIDQEIKSNFPEEISRIALKIIEIK